ncbi:MAG: hypothetical protein ABSH06_26460, partial [Thermodesulfobacteriota bacterium]
FQEMTLVLVHASKILVKRCVRIRKGEEILFLADDLQSPHKERIRRRDGEWDGVRICVLCNDRRDILLFWI